jgi:epoxide hydrolase 4
MGGAVWLTEPVREQYRAQWRRGLQGALNYYRALPLRPAQAADDALHAVELPAATVNVQVPTTVLWG